MTEAKVLATPKVRKFARELGANVAEIQGSERKGRVTEEDVKKYISKKLDYQAGSFKGKIKNEYEHSEFGEIEIKEIPRIKRIAAPHLVNSWKNPGRDFKLRNGRARSRVLNSKSYIKVVDLYYNDGLLLGTFSDKERIGPDLILEYFENLLKSKVDVEIITQHKHESEFLVTNSGLYNFIVDGKIVNARFSFVFIKTENDWKILSHHSSVLPESH